MSPRTERRSIEGLVGPIEIALDYPVGAPLGCAFVGHPHPLYGGTLDNKVTATLARAFAALGWIAVRPNFRGVGGTAGTHDHGDGETEDLLHVIAQLPVQLGVAGGAQAIGGFSFGSFVAARAAERLASAGQGQSLGQAGGDKQQQGQTQGQGPRYQVYVGSAAGKWPMPKVPANALVVHGEYDETIPLADVLAWARPQDLPVIVLPGADHFFHRRLSILKQLIVNHVAAQRVLKGGLPS